MRPLHLVSGDPALVAVEACADQAGKVIVKGVAGAVLAVETLLEIAARGAVRARTRGSADGRARVWWVCAYLQIFDFG